MYLKNTVFCLATFHMVGLAYSKGRDILNDKPQLKERRKYLEMIVEFISFKMLNS